MRRFILLTLLTAAGVLAVTLPNNRHQSVDAQQRGALTPEQTARRNSIEKELQSIAVVDRKLMVAMRDGKRMAADVYRPKDASKKYPTVFVRTPYNFNFWDVRNGVPRDLSSELDAVKRGYAFVEMNERGHFFSEGNYDILGPQRQGWLNRLLFDCRMAIGRGGTGQCRVGGDHPAGFRSRRRTRRSIFRTGKLVSRRRRANALHRLDLR